MDDFRYVREMVPAIKAASFYGCRINKGKMVCCFHKEDTPSLSFNGNYFKCFGCGAGGSSIDFVMKFFNMSSLQAVAKINDDFCLGLKLKGLNLKEEQILRARLRKRDEENEKIEKFNKLWIELYGKICERYKFYVEMAERNIPNEDMDDSNYLYGFARQKADYYDWLSQTMMEIWGVLEKQIELYKFCRRS